MPHLRQKIGRRGNAAVIKKTLCQHAPVQALRSRLSSSRFSPQSHRECCCFCSVLPQPSGNIFAGSGLQYPNGAGSSPAESPAIGQTGSVRRENRPVNPVVFIQGSCQSPCGDIPELQCMVPACGHESLAVRRKRQIGNRCGCQRNGRFHPGSPRSAACHQV